MATRGYNPKQIFYYPPVSPLNPVIFLHGNKNASNVITDKSGNGNDGTVSGVVTFEKDISDVKWRAHGVSDPEILVSDAASINDNPAQTFQFTINAHGTGESAEGRIFDKGSYYAFYDGTNIDFRQGFSGTEGRWTFPVPQDIWCFVQIAYDKSDVTNNPSVWINGASVTVTETQAPVGTYTTDVGSDLYIFDRSANDRAANVEMSVFTLFDSVLSAQNLSDEYRQYALGFPMRPTPRDEYPTTGLLTAPNHVGPWFNWNQSHAWLDDGNNRYFANINQRNDYSSIKSTQAYGAWYARINRVDPGTYLVLGFAMAEPNLNYNASPQTGYFLLIGVPNYIRLYETTSGAFTLLANSGNNWLPDTGELETVITHRRSDGLFTAYSRDGNHATWTQIFTVTDNTHTSSAYFQFYNVIVNGDHWIYDDLLFYPHGDSLVPNDIPIIAD